MSAGSVSEKKGRTAVTPAKAKTKTRKSATYALNPNDLRTIEDLAKEGKFDGERFLRWAIINHPQEQLRMPLGRDGLVFSHPRLVALYLATPGPH